MDNKIALTVQHLSENVSDIALLQDITIEIHRGSFVGVFGPDDSGKTRLLHWIMGFRKNVGDTIQLFGESVESVFQTKSDKVRFVPDNILWEDISAREYLDFCKRNCQKYDTKIEGILIEALSIPIDEVLTEMTYSENKMVQIVGAICARPQLIILDEPSNFLSKEDWKKILFILDSLKQNGMTVLVTAEKHNFFYGYADQVIYMKEGKIYYQGENIPENHRKKIVTILGDNRNEIASYMEEKICDDERVSVFLYSGTSQRLLSLLDHMVFENVNIEDLSMEEELDCNYERWI